MKKPSRAMLKKAQQKMAERLDQLRASQEPENDDPTALFAEDLAQSLDDAAQSLEYIDDAPHASPDNRKISSPAIADGPRIPGQPLWMPEGLDLDNLPVEIRQAAEEIVKPAYEQLVLRADPGLQRSLGASLVHLLWLEILDQFDIKHEYSTACLTLDRPVERRRSVEHHVRLLDAKLRQGRFLLRLEESRRAAAKTRLPRESQGMSSIDPFFSLCRKTDQSQMPPSLPTSEKSPPTEPSRDAEPSGQTMPFPALDRFQDSLDRVVQ
jgi:hypothetical protein